MTYTALVSAANTIDDNLTVLERLYKGREKYAHDPILVELFDNSIKAEIQPGDNVND